MPRNTTGKGFTHGFRTMPDVPAMIRFMHISAGIIGMTGAGNTIFNRGFKNAVNTKKCGHHADRIPGSFSAGTGTLYPEQEM
jgi:hypothetical protein